MQVGFWGEVLNDNGEKISESGAPNEPPAPPKAIAATGDGPAILEALNPKQRLFLSLIMEGNKTVEAYNKAGYKGDEHAAYTLKTRLNKALHALAEARGMTRADLMVQVQHIMELPLIRVDSQGKAQAAEGITVDQWIKLAHLKEKIVPDSKVRPNITAVQINFGEDNKSATIEIPQAPNQDIIDTEML